MPDWARDKQAANTYGFSAASAVLKTAMCTPLIFVRPVLRTNGSRRLILRVPFMRKGQNMKIRIRYENKNTEFEVTEEDCQDMVEADYAERKAQAQPGEVVSKRTVQEILDERFNKPEYNCLQKVKRNTCSLESFSDDFLYHINPGINPADVQDCAELVETVQAAIATLTPQQQNLLRQIFYEGMTEIEVAQLEGVTKAAVSQRMQRIYEQLRKKLKNF